MNTKLQCAKDMYGYKKPYTICSNIDGKVYKFDNDFIMKLDRYLAGVSACGLTKSDKKSIDSFVQYGSDQAVEDQVNKQLDQLLGKIVEMMSPEYIAVSQVVPSDDKIQVSSLVQALGNLENMNKESQELMSATQQVVKDALDEAQSQALIFS